MNQTAALGENGAPRVLVVDDEARVRTACRRVLETEGYAISEAGDGAEGLVAIERERPDLVLVDLMMPNMTGLQLLAAARRSQPDLAFVVITGYATLDKAVEAMKEGADDFLAKPFKPRELRLVVDRVLKRVRTLHDMAIEKSRTRALVNNLSTGVLVVDGDGRLALANQALRELLGLAEDPDGLAMGDLPGCADVAQALGDILAAGAEAAPLCVMLQLGPAEEPVYLQVRCAPFNDGRGRLVGAVAIFEDVSALKRLDQLKSEFVSMVAHEIASPLAAVVSQLQTMQKGIAGPLTEKQSHLVSRAGERVGSIINLSKELLDLARIEAGTMGEAEDVDLGGIIAEALDIVAEPAKAKGHELASQVPEDLPALKGVRRGIFEVVLNLLSNAVKYTPDGGRVEVRARAEGDTVVVEVADNGLGLTPEDAARVFDRFYRVRNADTRLINGTGLGLPIVKKVVEAHGGTVTVESSPGQGSTFTVRLPRGGPGAA